MSTARTRLASAALAVAAAATFALAAPLAADSTEPDGFAAAALEKMRSLAGTWRGDAAETGRPLTVEYAVVGAGSAVVERLFPGTDHEMLTVFHLDGEDFVATHYCTTGNQPRLRLDRGASTANDLQLDLAGGTNLDNGRLHVAGARFRFVDADHVVADWSFVNEPAAAGEKSGGLHLELTRQ